MAIGTTAAIIGASAISAGASIIGGNRAAGAAEDASDVQAQASRESNALNREIYYDQAERLEPFRQLGVSAINPLSDLLGLDYQTGGQGYQMPNGQYVMPPSQGDNSAPNLSQYFGGGTRGYNAGQQLQTGGFDTQAYFAANPDVAQSYYPGSQGFNSADDYARAHWETNGRNEGRDLGIPQNRLDMLQGGANQAQGGITAALTPQDRSQSAIDALTTRPGYQFRLQQGNDAYEASAAARGMQLSGAQAQGLAQYNQDFASNEYDNEINRLLTVMGGGQVATNSQNGAAGQFGLMSNQNNMNAANARASGYINAANAQSRGLTGASNSIWGGIGAYGGTQGWFDPKPKLPDLSTFGPSYNI